MKRLLAKHALGIAGMLLLTAVPAFPSVVLNFNFGSGTGTYTGSGSTIAGSFTVTNFEENNNGTITYSPSQLGNTANLFAIVFNNSTDTLTFSNNASAGSLTDVGSLYSAVTSLTMSNSGSALNDTVSGVIASSAINSAFLTDLGLASGQAYAVTGSISGTGGNVTSDTLEFTAVPEPAPMYMLGAGLLALAAIARKRRSVTA